VELSRIYTMCAAEDLCNSVPRMQRKMQGLSSGSLKVMFID
jgi:hypothetical protein